MDLPPSGGHDPANIPPQAYAQRTPSMHSNIRQQLDVGHIYRQALPTSGASGHPRPIYTPASFQPAVVPQRFQSPSTYIPFRETPHYRQQQVVAHDPSQAFKKIRVHDPNSDAQQPLRIDVPEYSTAYTPQVEAVSPTFPPEIIIEDTVRATKEDLLQQINKVDREIAQTEQKISQLKIQKEELEANSSRPEEEQLPEEEAEAHTAKAKPQSLAQKIYAENRKKAMEAHRILEPFGAQIEVPLYNQPSDTPVYKENARKHALFKDKLIEHLRAKAAARIEYEQSVAAKYSELMVEWQRRLEKIEKKRGKDTKYREEFEKTFPELRKQREDKERFNRVGARVKSEADMEEIMDGLQEQELEEKKMRSYAVVPPMMLDPVTRRYRYKNTNGLIHDFTKTYKERQFFNYWSPQEHEVFKEKYMQHPKNFGLIASYLERKSVKETVLHYYLTKKHENFKQLLRKNRQGRTRASRNNPPTPKVPPAPAPEAPSGVTTRLQREQLQRQDPGPSAGPSVPAIPALTVPAVPVASTSASCSSAPPPPPAPATVTAAAPTPPPPPPPPPPQPSTSTAGTEVVSCENKTRRKGDKKIDETESSDEDVPLPTDRTGQHNCVVCNAVVESTAHSRHLPKNQAYQYGLLEGDIPTGGRVCNSCRCKAVRSRCMVCPLPTCPNAKSVVKRLRTIPSKWTDLPREVLEPIVNEFQIPTGTLKCCSACFARISRRVAPHLAPEEDSLKWSDQEIEALKAALKSHGTQWKAISGLMTGRSQQQCKNFYFNFRKKYKLDTIVYEYYKTNFEESKPAVTDEEESGSSTSSCDEQPAGCPDTSDTASAGSPAKHVEALTVSVGKEPMCRSLETRARGDRDYESSAMADEGQIGDSLIYPHLPGTSISAIGGPQSSSPPRTVKDLMANVIEKQLMKSPGGVSVGCTGPPTITSILKSDTVPFKRGNSDSLATLSVVGPNGQQDIPKEQNPNVVVLSLAPQQTERISENETLDLSMKKRDTSGDYSHSSPAHHLAFAAPSHSKSSQSHFSRDTNYYVAVPSKHTPHIVMSHPLAQHPSRAPSPGMPKLSPKIMPSSQSSKPGSITHGTPFQSSPRFDGLLRQIPSSQHKEGGSITQGTPVHHLLPASDKRQNYHYYKGSVPPNTTFNSPYGPVGPVRQPTTYSLEPQLSSRQIILNDYITSQQMLGSRRVPMSVSDKTDRALSQLYYSSPPGGMYLPSRSPAESATPPLRQGVIQRHNTIVSSSQGPSRGHGAPTGKVHYPPPGHEAFSSLVEAAVQQPSLPVPSNEKKSQYREHPEGLGKTMADSISSSRIMEHGRMSGNIHVEQQHRVRQGQERDRIMSQREHEQRYQVPREQRDPHHQQLQIQIQRQQQARMEQQSQQARMEQQSQQARMEQQSQQARMEQQSQQARMEQQSRLEQQARMESRMDSRDASRHEQPGSSRLEYDAKQQRHQQQLAAFMDAQTRASGEREREKDRERDWDRGEGSRVLMANYPRDRHLPSHVITGPTSPSRGSATPGKGSSRGDSDSTMTAASLIDAIITHQINQTSDSSGPGSQPPGTAATRPGDRLFQGFPAPNVEPNGKRSGSPLERDPIKNLALSDHFDSIITKDLSIPPYSYHYQLPAEDQQNWKLRRVGGKESEASREREKTDERQIIRMAQPQPGGSKAYHEPVSPPDQWPSRYYQEKPSHLSPLDYVKNRIVEVMRTSEDTEGDEKSKEGASPSDLQSEDDRKVPTECLPTSTSAFSFPYSAVGGHGVCVPNSPTPTKPSGEEPAPLLSSQYDPLSDEDE